MRAWFGALLGPLQVAAPNLETVVPELKEAALWAL